MRSGLKTRHTLDKSGWGDGPWQDEPDEAVWFRPPYSLRIWRHPYHGQLNGYVGVLPDHPLYGQSYENIYDLGEIEVHGGLTFAGTEMHQDTNIWWFGFDTHHMWDFAPGYQATMVEMNLRHPELPPMPSTMFDRLVYRDFDYVVAETESLCLQLEALVRAGGTTSTSEPPSR